ncbi:MAG: ArnT family glycosyltransferase [Phycisphaerae bacterium]
MRRQHTSGRSYRFRLGAIVAAAVVLRVGLLVYADRRPALFEFPDSHRYVDVARNIARGLGPIETDGPVAGTDPLYPFLLALWIPVVGDEEAVIMRVGRILNAAFAVASVLFLAALARRLAGDHVGLFAAVMLAIDPILLFFNALVLTETAYITVLLAGVYCIVRLGTPSAIPTVDRESRPLSRGDGGVAGHSGRPPIADRLPTWAILGGVCLGLGTLLRSSGLLIPLALAPFVWHRAGGGDRWRRSIGATACFLLAGGVMQAPTIIRNARLFHAFVPVRTGSGASLMEGLGPWADGGPGMDRIVYPAGAAGAGEIERDRLCRREALAWARAHPAEALRLAWVKLKRTWSIALHATGYVSWPYRVICWLTVAPVFALAAGGIVLWRRRRWEVLLLLLPAVYFTLVHMVFVGSVRYRVPAMPFLFVLAAVALRRFLVPPRAACRR